MTDGTTIKGTRGTCVSTLAGRRPLLRRGRLAAMAASAVALVGVSACTSGGSGTRTSGPSAASRAGDTGAPASPPASTSSAAATPASITTSVAGGTKAADPAEPVTVTVAHGTLTSVSVVNPAGKKVAGSLAADGSSWTTTEDLGYARTYTLTATAKDADGRATVTHTTISTVTPDNLTQPYFQTIYGTAMQTGATYGVGMIASVHFDEAIPDKAAATKALTVTTSPHVDGAWYWTSDSTAHWRPKSYYAPGTKVTISASVYGKDLGSGLYGQSDQRTSFVVGAKHYSVASAKTHQVKVYVADELVRTMPTSMGQGGYVQGKNGKISLWTMPGIYTVINHENPAVMSSDSYGLPASSPYGYAAEKVPYATKISIDGIYLHELDTTVWAQGHQNVSHGCLNLNETNAKWFYDLSRVGDVVKVVDSGGPAITVDQGGDWSVPWSTWSAGGVS